MTKAGFQIKSWDGIVLYAAKGAADVRAALEDAAKNRANLTRADLSGAYLTGANLTRANLSRANLTRANLSRANLTRADLSGADLSGAYLTGAALYGAALYGADLSGAALYGANLIRADLSGADLYGANLIRADLSGAYLTGANLTRAALSGANLTRAALSRADLYGATGINAYRMNDLLMLRDQPGPIRAYKLVNAENEGPFNGGIKYVIGKVARVKDADTDETKDCAAGINVATLPWCIREWQPGYRILIVEFTAKDIAAIPIGDGKFRLHGCRVVGEKDLTELGLA